MHFGFAPVQSQFTFEAMRRQAGLAEALGFGALWAHEHHSQGMMYGDPLMTLAALAPVTKTIRLGTSEKRTALALYAKALLGFYDAWGHTNIARLSPDARAPEKVSEEHFILGEPAECIERIRAYAALGIDAVACLMNFGNPDVEFVEQSMRRFGEQVLPHVAT